MAIQLKEVLSKKEITQFLKFPIELYKNCEPYAPQLLMEEKKLFNQKKEPFYKKGKVKLYIAVQNEKIVGRIACIVNTEHNQLHKDKVGFFGFYDCINDKEVSKKLLDKAKEYALQNEMDTLRGPMNFSVSHTIGCLSKGFEHLNYLLTTYNYAYYNDLLKDYGFEPEMLLYNYRITNQQEIPEKLKRVAKAMETRGNFDIKKIYPKDLPKVVKEIQHIYNEAWKDNWGFLPLDDSMMDALATELKPILVPEIAYMAYDQGKAVGCMINLPNANEFLKDSRGSIFSKGFFNLVGLVLGWKKTKGFRTVIMGVLESHRKKGVEAILIHKTIEEGLKIGYEEAEMGWILENNTMMNRQLENMNAERYREHTLYDLKIK